MYTTLSSDVASPESETNLVSLVAIPVEIMTEIDAYGLHGLAKDVVYWVIHRHMTIGRSTGLHQGLLDKSVCPAIRKQVTDFIDSSGYVRPALSGLYRRGAQAMRYHLIGVDHIAEALDHHNYERCCKWDGGDECKCMDGVVWRTVDFRPLMRRIEGGFIKKGWDLARMNAEWSLNQADAPRMTDAEIIEHFTPIDADGEIGPTDPNDKVKVDAHQTAYETYRDRRTDRIHIRDGRTYTSVTSLPRWIREREVVFQGAAESLDISACYWWCLAADVRVSRIRHGLDTLEIDGMLDLIEGGEFYAAMAAGADMPYDTDADKKAVKEAVQTYCLFGPIGWHPLWRTLQSMCPQICKTIHWWHRQRNGRSELSYFLMRAEGQLMTDGLVRWLVSGGVPAIQIHDGAIVPVGAATVAAEWLSQHSRRIYGRSCRIKVVIDSVASYV